MLVTALAPKLDMTMQLRLQKRALRNKTTLKMKQLKVG